MLRSLVNLAVLAALAGGASAQCFAASGAPVTLVPDLPGYPATDEGKTAPLPLGFTFPMAGVGYAITHAVVDSNGEVYLTDGGGVVMPSNFGTSSLASMRGGPGGSARVIAVGGDNEGPHPTSQVLVDAATPGRFQVSFVDWSRYFAGQAWDCSVTLFQSGEIRFDYGQGFEGFDPWDFVGVSIGDDVGSAAVAPSDLTAGGASNGLGLVYENAWPPFDLELRSITFTPDGAGGFDFAPTCHQVPAAHQPIGRGCYDIARQCVYQAFGNPAAMAATLQGRSLTFTPVPTASGYVVTLGAGGFVAPTPAAVDLHLGDDQEANVTPSQPFVHLGTPVPTLSVCSNGFVNMGPIGSNVVAAYGSPYYLTQSPVASFRSNADYDPSAGGAVVVEEIGATLYVTFADVPRLVGGQPDRFQLQFELASGVVRMVWDQLAASAPASPTVVGYAPGLSMDPGSTDLLAALPLQTAPDVPALRLSASPAPVSTATAGTPVVYQVEHIPDANVNSGVFFGMTILSLTGSVAGNELTSLGMPGCRLHPLSFDLTLPFVGASPSQAVALAVPAGVPAGARLFAQSV
ncbi:MAG: hypothetical protein KAI24_10770, partial [Planctomycetes bacterium]|nr:hypothetical protein [Planctomycetota bacterium]